MFITVDKNFLFFSALPPNMTSDSDSVTKSDQYFKSLSDRSYAGSDVCPIRTSWECHEIPIIST